MKLVRRLTDPTGAQTQLKTNGRRIQNFTFSLMRHHITPVPGWAYPRPRPPRARPAPCPPAFVLGGFFFEPDPCRCAPLDRACEGCFHEDWNVIEPRLAQSARFFAPLVTQGTALHGGGCQYLPLESTTGPTLPDGSPRNSTLLMALHSTHLLPTGPSVPPRGAFSLFNCQDCTPPHSHSMVPGGLDVMS